MPKALLLLLLATAAVAAPPRLHLEIQGEGTPAVVLESGFGGTSRAWAAVQPDVAKFARVVAYDRAGLGNSEPGEAPRTAKRIAEELHEALASAGIQPPYLLVGHSAGGGYVRVFAHMYPKEVAGIVLIDPPHEELLDWIRVNAPHADRMPPDRMAAMPAGMRAEWIGRELVIEELRKAWPLPRVPVVLLTSARHDQSLREGVSDAALQVLTDARKQWLARVPGARHIVTEKSGHNIPKEEPALVVDAIRQVITKRD